MSRVQISTSPQEIPGMAHVAVQGRDAETLLVFHPPLLFAQLPHAQELGAVVVAQ